MKKIALVLLASLILTAALPFCAGAAVDAESLRGTTINVYNWGEYISDGSEGSLDVIKAFEDKYGINVNDTNYASNEDMYAKMKSGAVSYDVVIPSDYMIARLIDEGLIQKLDFANIPNYKNIAEKYKGQYFDPKDEYSVPYNVGMTGVIYNTKMVSGEPTSWALMWDETYKGQILNFNNPRDAFATAQFLLGLDVNSTNEEEWKQALEKLKEQKPLLQGYVMDEIFNKMENGEAAVAPYYAGDYISMSENNPDLAFYYPEEGTNFFIDSMCVPTSAKNKAGGELFINFMLDKEIATANAEYICYASPNTLVFENEDYAYYQDELLYPTKAVKTEIFENLPQESLALMNNLWEQLKIEGGISVWVYVICGAVVAVLAAFVISKQVKKAKSRKNY